MNRPNRSKYRNAPGANPKPEHVRAAREKVGLTQTEAARLVYAGLTSWQQWEAPEDTPAHRRMHSAFWELFRLKISMLTLDEVLKAAKLPDASR